MNNKFVFILIGFLVPNIRAIGQQNFFNVPSSDITDKNKLFFQQQFNFIKEGVQSNTTLSYGLGKGFEIGVNYLGLSLIDKMGKLEIPFNSDEDPYNPFLTLNAQKRFKVSELFGLALGAQYGLTTTKQVKDGGYAYGNAIYNNEHIGLKIIGGIYMASNDFFGDGGRLGQSDKIGIQTGIEQHIIKNKLMFQADFISGHHNLGEVVVGGAYKMSHHWIASAGYQIPTVNSLSVKALVVEFTFIPN